MRLSWRFDTKKAKAAVFSNTLNIDMGRTGLKAV